MFNLTNPRNASEALRQAKAYEKGIAIVGTSEYFISSPEPGLFSIEKFDGKHYQAAYTLSTETGKCTCPAYAKDHFCKHQIAVLETIRRDAQSAQTDLAAREWEAMLADAECSTGCDYPEDF